MSNSEPEGIHHFVRLQLVQFLNGKLQSEGVYNRFNA